MKKISMITQHDMNIPNGSTIRPKWQFEALKKNDFENVELIDSFNEKGEFFDRYYTGYDRYLSSTEITQV